MSSNRNNYDFPQNNLNRSSSNIKLNYHFLNRNQTSNNYQYKSSSPLPNNIQSKYRNFYEMARKTDYYYEILKQFEIKVEG